MRMRSFNLLFVLILFSNLCHSQIPISGRIIDAGNGEPVSFASITALDNHSGTMSNEQGEFLLQIPAGQVWDSLRISRLAYKTTVMSVADLRKEGQVHLEELSQVLSEVVISSWTGPSLVEKAVSSISQNHQVHPYESRGFYRMASEQPRQYLQLSEAVFKQRHACGHEGSDQLVLEKVRTAKDECTFSNINFSIQPEDLFEMDIVNHLKSIPLLTKSGLRDHSFQLEGEVQLGDRPAFRVAFDQNDHAKKPGYKGFIYIDQESFAFLHFDIAWSPKSMGDRKYGSPADRMLLGILGFEVSPMEYNLDLNYRKVGGQYCLSDARSRTVLRLKNNRLAYEFPAETRVHFILSSIDTGFAGNFPAEEILNGNAHIERLASDSNPEFWKGETILLPDMDYAQIARAIDSVNKACRLKGLAEQRLYKLPKDPVLRIDSILAYYHDRGGFSGNALLAKEGEVIFQKSYPGAGESLSESALFRIGSTAKTFTATLVMQLEAEGKLKLEDTLGKFVPGHVHGKVTLAQLLSHQSGIPNFFNNARYTRDLLSKVFPLEVVAEQFCSDPLEFEPGSSFSYSNSGYVLLALVVEKVTGQSFGEALETRIFKPFGMKSAFFGNALPRDNMAVGYLNGSREETYPLGNVAGAGGIGCSAEDLFQWSQGLENANLMPPELRKRMWTPRAEYVDWNADYGCGWMIDKGLFGISKAHKVYYHPGTDLGFWTMFLKVPDLGITLVLLSNHGEFARFDIADLILEELD